MITRSVVDAKVVSLVANRTTGHSATRLLDGRVLIAGGGRAGISSAPVSEGEPGSLVDVEIFDASCDRSSAASSMAHGREDHQAALLPSGEVVVVGGMLNVG